MFKNKDEEIKEFECQSLSDIQEEQKEYYDSPFRNNEQNEGISPSRKL